LLTQIFGKTVLSYGASGERISPLAYTSSQGMAAPQQEIPMNRYLIRSVAIMAVLFGTVTSSVAGGGSFTRGCAARDMQVLMMLEQLDSGNDVAAQQMNEVMSELFDARMVCFSGRVLDALMIYDNLARRISPMN